MIPFSAIKITSLIQPAIILALLSAVGIQTLRLSDKEVDLIQAKSQLAILTPAVEECNSTVTELKENTDALIKDLNEAKRIVKIKSAQDIVVITEIREQIVPKTCEDSMVDLVSKLQSKSADWSKK